MRVEKKKQNYRKNLFLKKITTGSDSWDKKDDENFERILKNTAFIFEEQKKTEHIKIKIKNIHEKKRNNESILCTFSIKRNFSHKSTRRK